MLFADTLDPIKRNTKDQLFLVQIKVAPAPDNKEGAKFGGAYASAWVDAETLQEAAQKALSSIKEAGWDPVEFMHWELVTRDNYSVATHKEDELRTIHQCIATAMEHGVCLIFSVWPKRRKRGR